MLLPRPQLFFIIVHDCYGSDDDEEAFSIHVDASSGRKEEKHDNFFEKLKFNNTSVAKEKKRKLFKKKTKLLN